MAWKSYAAEARGGGQQTATIKAEETALRFFQPKAGTPRLCVRIGHEVLKKAKLNFKDTVDLLVNEDGSEVLIKKAERGWKLGQVTNGAGEFSVPWGDKALFSFKQKGYTKVESKLAEGGIALSVPQEEVSAN
jgi:hypothetical protein